MISGLFQIRRVPTVCRLPRAGRLDRRPDPRNEFHAIVPAQASHDLAQKQCTSAQTPQRRTPRAYRPDPLAIRALGAATATIALLNETH